MDERLGPKCDAPQRVMKPDVKAVLASKAKTFRKIAADLEELADAIGNRVNLTVEQTELLGELVGAGVDSFTHPSAARIIRY